MSGKDYDEIVDALKAFVDKKNPSERKMRFRLVLSSTMPTETK